MSDSNRTALICGVSGQDGTYLAQLPLPAFAEVALDWRDHMDVDERLFRPADISFASANPLLARERLGCSARATMPDVVHMMLKAELAESAD